MWLGFEIIAVVLEIEELAFEDVGCVGMIRNSSAGSWDWV